MGRSEGQSEATIWVTKRAVTPLKLGVLLALLQPLKLLLAR